MSQAWKFVTATIVVSWGAVAIYWGLGGEWNSIPATIFAVGYMFIPLMVGLVLARREEGRGIK